MKSFVFVVMLFVSMTTLSCDVCGGMSSNTNIGLFAASTSFHQVGIRNNFRYFKTYLYGIDHSNEYVLTNEIFGRWQVAERIQVLGSVPFQSAWQKRSLGKDFIQGLGDPSTIVNCILSEKIDSTGMTKQFLTAGFGSKFPFGKSALPEDELKNLYPGTGSLDLLFLLNHLYQYSSKWGQQTEISYVLKGQDKHEYRFGNALLVQSQLIYRKKLDSWQLLSTIGLQYEHQAPSKLEREVISENPNSSSIFSLKASVNLLANKWLWSFQIQQPIYQQINLFSVEQKFYGTIGLFYFIKKTNKNERS